MESCRVEDVDHLPEAQELCGGAHGGEGGLVYFVDFTFKTHPHMPSPKVTDLAGVGGVIGKRLASKGFNKVRDFSNSWKDLFLSTDFFWPHLTWPWPGPGGAGPVPATEEEQGSVRGVDQGELVLIEISPMICFHWIPGFGRREQQAEFRLLPVPRRLVRQSPDSCVL